MARTFVTGGTGFIGSAVVDCALVAGHEVHVLTRSQGSAGRVKEQGATPVLGDLGVAGPWQEAAAECDTIVHLAQPDTYGARVTRRRAEAYRENRLTMDRNLFERLTPSRLQRIVYVAGTSYYGNQGTELRDETTRPNPKGWGPYIAPALDLLPGYLDRGYPIVLAFPGWVYGPASWFAEYNLKPLADGKPVFGLTGRSRFVSPVHQTDVARALVHLIDVGVVGDRYFVVDDEPVPSVRLPETAAKALGVPLRTRRFPPFLCTLFVGPIVTESLTCDARLSNQRLKESGFRLEYPTIEQGIPEVVTRWRSQQARSASATGASG